MGRLMRQQRWFNWVAILLVTAITLLVEEMPGRRWMFFVVGLLWSIELVGVWYTWRRAMARAE